MVGQGQKKVPINSLKSAAEGKKKASNELAIALLKRCVETGRKIPRALSGPLLRHCDAMGIRVPTELVLEIGDFDKKETTDSFPDKLDAPVARVPNSPTPQDPTSPLQSVEAPGML